MVRIEKEAVIAEIEKRMKDWWYGSSIEAKYKREECDDILSFIDTLEVKEIGVDFGDPKGDKSAKYIIDTKTIEVKEVELEKEIPLQWSKFCLNGKDKDYFVKVAKYFFELGMSASNKAQKGE